MAKERVKQCSKCVFYEHDPNTDTPNHAILSNMHNPEISRRWPDGIRRGGTCKYPYDKDPVGGGGPVDWEDWCGRFKQK